MSFLDDIIPGNDQDTEETPVANEPETPKMSTPSIDIDENFIVTASLDNLDPSITSVTFEFIKDNVTVLASKTVGVTTRHAETSISKSNGVTIGCKIKVRAVGNGTQWSDYSSNIVASKDNLPSLGAPSVEVTGSGTFQARYDDLPANVKKVQFQICMESGSSYTAVYTTNPQTVDVYGSVPCNFAPASHGLSLSANYKVRARGFNSIGACGDYSNLSEVINIQGAEVETPSAPSVDREDEQAHPTVWHVYNNDVNIPGVRKLRYEFYKKFSDNNWRRVKLTDKLTISAVSTCECHYAVAYDTQYKVRVRAFRNDGKYSEWSSFTDIESVPKPVTPPTLSDRPIVTFIGLEAGTDTFYGTWKWDINPGTTAGYETKWQYFAGGKWFDGQTNTITISSTLSAEEAKIDKYTPPENATKIRLRVKPVSKTHTVNGNDTVYFIAKWSTDTDKSVRDVPNKEEPLPAPSAPTLELDDEHPLVGIATAQFGPDDIHVASVVFKFYKDGGSSPCKITANLPLDGTRRASCRYQLEPGSRYNVQVRAYKSNGSYSDYSDISQDVFTQAVTPGPITTCIQTKPGQVHLVWGAAAGATGYKIQYTPDDPSHFDTLIDVSTQDVPKVTTYDISGLESGHAYYFRVCATSSNGAPDSYYTKPVGVTTGSKPDAPTTWSSVSTIKSGDNLNLYWLHNSSDSSVQSRYAIDFGVIAQGTQSDIWWVSENDPSHLLAVDDSDRPDDDKTMTRVANITVSDEMATADTITIRVVGTSSVPEWTYTFHPEIGSGVYFRVKTAGVKIEDSHPAYSDWSYPKEIKVYEQPTIQADIMVKSTTSDTWFATNEINRFPFKVSSKVGPKNQRPIGYNLQIRSLSTYETVDEFGNSKTVSAGSNVYEKDYDMTNVTYDSSIGAWLIESMFNAGNVSLENNITYAVLATVFMDSGLSASDGENTSFTVKWAETEFYPFASVSYDPVSMSAVIGPYSVNESNLTDETLPLDPNIRLSVYRRDYNGSFTEIATGIQNGNNTYVVDPHPSLDIARYRIVARSVINGNIAFNDIPGLVVHEKAAVIQWNEAWTDFDVTDDNPDVGADNSAWGGSIIKLPYNLDVSDNNSRETSLVNYIGRKYPVSYYGTHIDSTATWSMEIPKTDKETLYALRRLAEWLGDVYVREPSGSGYWANVSVSFSQTHCEVTIPITLDIKRVEGGV